jgi:hypothetical protein
MAQTPPENRRVDQNVPRENQPPVVDEVGGIPVAFESLAAPGAITVGVGITELRAAGDYTLANGTKEGQEKIITNPQENMPGVDYTFHPKVVCNYWKGFSANYDPATTGQRIGLSGPMAMVHLKWCVGVPTQSWGAQDCWVPVGGPGISNHDFGTDAVSRVSFDPGVAPS